MEKTSLTIYEERLRSNVEAINRWMYFSWNYPSCPWSYFTPWGEERVEYIPVFIRDARWSCPISHLIEKWKGICHTTPDPHAVMSRFYSELSSTNRAALLEYVLDNYDNEMPIYP